MVERTNTAGWWPSVYQPIRKAGEKLVDWFAPRSDALVSEAHYEINMELPGVSSEDIDISMQNGNLIVRGEKHFESEQHGDNYFFSEREYGAFQRSFRMPADANVDGISADFTNGVLKVTIPKIAPQTAENRKISIKSSG